MFLSLFDCVNTSRSNPGPGSSSDRSVITPPPFTPHPHYRTFIEQNYTLLSAPECDVALLGKKTRTLNEHFKEEVNVFIENTAPQWKISSTLRAMCTESHLSFNKHLWGSIITHQLLYLSISLDTITSWGGGVRGWTKKSFYDPYHTEKLWAFTLCLEQCLCTSVNSCQPIKAPGCWLLWGRGEIRRELVYWATEEVKRVMRIV